MEKQMLTLDGRTVRRYGAPDARLLILQPIDARESDLPEEELAQMAEGEASVSLAAFSVKDWDRELSPWTAPPVFGKTPFGGGAEETLRFLMERLIPALSPTGETKLCIGGYSLAGLFALWAATKTEVFSGAAGVSPSVWFPGWPDYLRDHPIRSKAVYLSLGDREEWTKNPVMAAVGERIRAQYALLRETHECTLEWNPGNHFQDCALRCARGFLWLARHMSHEKDSGR